VIQADFIVPWRPVIETTNTDMSFSLPDTAELDRYRLYIAAMRALSHEIPEAMVQASEIYPLLFTFLMYT
jgi:hypothetical protein